MDTHNINNHNSRTIRGLTIFTLAIGIMGTMGFMSFAKLSLGEAIYETIMILRKPQVNFYRFINIKKQKINK